MMSLCAVGIIGISYRRGSAQQDLELAQYIKQCKRMWRGGRGHANVWLIIPQFGPCQVCYCNQRVLIIKL